MKLRAWLKKENKSTAWLAQQLGVNRSRIDQAFSALKNGKPLPFCWIPAILRITNEEVTIKDEWKVYWERPATRRGHNAYTARKASARIQSGKQAKSSDQKNPDSTTH